MMNSAKYLKVYLIAFSGVGLFLSTGLFILLAGNFQEYFYLLQKLAIDSPLFVAIIYTGSVLLGVHSISSIFVFSYLIKFMRGIIFSNPTQKYYVLKIKIKRKIKFQGELQFHFKILQVQPCADQGKVWMPQLAFSGQT